MRRISTLFMMGALAVVSLAHGQEAKEQENVQYEELKVLEPIIGTWGANWTNEQNGEQGEIQMTYSWSSSRKMIMCASRIRKAQPGADLATQDWVDGGPRYYYVWNVTSKCIEVYALYTGIGEAVVSKVEPKGDNKFEMTVIHAAADVSRGDAILTIKEDEVVTKVINRKGDDGEKWKDLEMVHKRVK